jgi:hypothetical protein
MVRVGDDVRVLRIDGPRGKRKQQRGEGRGGDSNQADSETTGTGRPSGTIGRSSG